MSVLSDIQKQEQKLEMTPMIDVTFLLLIFFMCTIKFKTLEGKLSAYLPKDIGVNTTQAEPIEKVDIVIAVLKEGERMHPTRNEEWDGESPRFRYAGREIEYRVGPNRIRDAQDLLRRLQTLRDADPDRPATIDALPGVIYQDVVGALDAAIQAKFTEITFRGSSQ